MSLPGDCSSGGSGAVVFLRNEHSWETYLHRYGAVCHHRGESLSGTGHFDSARTHSADPFSFSNWGASASVYLLTDPAFPFCLPREWLSHLKRGCSWEFMASCLPAS